MPPTLSTLPWTRARSLHPSISNLFHPPNVTHHVQQSRSLRSILKPIGRLGQHDTHNRKLRPSAQNMVAARKRTELTTPYRTGVLAEKKGMSSIFDTETGERLPCTVLQIDQCQVVGHKTVPKHGYWGVQVGFGNRQWYNVKKAELGVLVARGIPPKQELREFRVKNEDGLLPIGTILEPSWFKVGQLVDCQSVTKGKGFAGGMKKHGWSGQPASHGQSLTHRTMGSAGGGQGSGSRVIPGKNMPGRMGHEWHTIQHLKVLKTDDENGVILVKGCLSGPRKGIVSIYDSKRRPNQKELLNLPMAATGLLATQHPPAYTKA